MSHWQQKIRSGFNRLLNMDDRLRDGKDNLALQYLAPLTKGYLPWSRFAMRPSGMVKILNDMVINQRFTVVECGAGLTTVYVASLMRQQDKGHLYSLEHDADWIAVVRDLLVQRGLESYVTFIHAPLVPSDLSLEGADWYDTAAIAPVIADQKIDLLVVDGPPAYDEARRYARYPAAPYFQKNFSDNYAVVLDDINRFGEQHVLTEWRRHIPGLQSKRFVNDGGVAICSNQSGFTVG
ncbi:class I SAM-dependent methyltransferase [filamentous cyanobacterium LEGE 11480]|uniref:Class I SAM-dependent methyltransferase n=1 Tax=Romeriopsis navalis LEGE 11480 TaxID=2777977 RepID=A0A928VR14_9CYAN|nr:class I SAM-dependent methyltransferase [Romeriopsis navalis]MBE9030554.1 class I SAM-dependent methyltransferase [Romeriopsis navalis LEGE 11480]